MARGDPTWHTSSTGPTSMPSSNDAVATNARRSPARSRSSTRRRRSLDRLPWWAATCSGPRRSPRRWARRSDNPPRVHEHQRGAVLAYVVGDAVDHLAELLGGRHRGELGVGKLDADLEAAGVAAVHDGRLGAVARAGEQTRRLLDGALGGRQSDALGPRAELQMLEALEGDGQVRAALVASQGVDLVDDHGGHGAEDGPAPLRRHEEVEALGGGDHERGRRLHHGGPGPGGGVAGPHRHGDGGDGQAELARHFGDLGQRTLEVLVDVDGQGLQRGHVHDAHRPLDVLARARRPGTARRWPPGSLPGSCPSPSGRRSACRCPGRCGASPVPGVGRGRRGTSVRTTWPRRDGSRPGRRRPAGRRAGPGRASCPFHHLRVTVGTGAGPAPTQAG